MQEEILSLLRCPVTGQSLRLQVIEEFDRVYQQGRVTEIKTGILSVPDGWIYPVIEGIPRMLPEAVYDYADFFRAHIRDFDQQVAILEDRFNKIASRNRQKNSRTKASFAMEWKFLHPEKKDRLWHFDQSSLGSLFLLETGLQEEDLEDKLVLDAGSGHGILTSVVAGMGATAIGMELSLAVENAYLRNKNSRAWYVQGDVQFPPLAPGSFDILYSSGVLHHTNNTKLSLSLIEPMLKTGGVLCLWLYQPRENKLHQLSMKARKVFSKLPLRLAVSILIIFILPVTFIIKKIRGQSDLHYREEIIDLLDAFTPEFREEIPQAQAMAWLQQLGLSTCEITSSGVFGYSITGNKTE